MSDGADQPPEQTTPAGQPSNDTGNALVVTGPFFQRTDWLSFGLTAVVVLVVYFRTLAPEVTLEYSGILSTSAKYAGVPQPPGYPVWTLYSWLFVTLLPFSNIAWRVAVGSAVAAALACGLVALMVSRAGTLLLETTPAFTSRKPAEQQLLRVVCGFVAGMALGLSRTVWRMAVVAETWALSVLLFTIMLCFLMRWTGRPERRRFLYGALFVFGLLLTSNQELFVMTPALLLVVILSDQELGRDLSLVISLLAIADWALSVLGLCRWPGSDMLAKCGAAGGLFAGRSCGGCCDRQNPTLRFGVEVGQSVRSPVFDGSGILSLPAVCLDDEPAGELGLCPHSRRLFPRDYPWPI